MPTKGQEAKSEELCPLLSDANSMHTGKRKLSRLAITSFVLSLITIPLVIICSVILRTVIYNPPLKDIAGITGYMSFALIPGSFLLGIGGLIHITLKRKTYCGYWMALAGILLSMILVVTLFYNIIRAMAEHLA